jgi:hypothetical protein
VLSPGDEAIVTVVVLDINERSIQAGSFISIWVKPNKQYRCFSVSPQLIPKTHTPPTF